MPKQQFKYKINHYISLLPRKTSLVELETELYEKYDISKSTFLRDRNIMVDEKRDLTVERLDAYVSIINKFKNPEAPDVNIDDLRGLVTQTINTGLVKP